MAPSRDPRAELYGQPKSPYRQRQRRPSAEVVPPDLHRVNKIRPSNSRRGRPDPLTFAHFSGGPYNDDHQSFPNDVGSDEHGPAQVNMSLIEEEMREILDASHEELDRRLNLRKLSSQHYAAINKHLALVSPPNSPHNPTTPPLSPRRKALRLQLQREEYDELIHSNAQFHTYMNDLVGIRQWWTANKKLWQQKRQQFIEIQEQIIYLNHARDQPTQRHDIYSNQIKEQRRAKVPLAKWFVTNKIVMKQVWSRFEELDAATRSMSARGLGNLGQNISQSGSGGDWRNVEEPHSFVYEQVRNGNISNFQWYHTRGLKWWTTPALSMSKTYTLSLVESIGRNRDSQDRIKEVIRNLEKNLEERLWLRQKLDKEVDDQVHFLERTRPQGYREAIREFLIDRGKEGKREAEDIKEKRASLYLHRVRLHEFEVYNTAMVDHRLRHETVRRILEWVSAFDDRQGGRGNIEFIHRNSQAINEIYKICFRHEKQKKAMNYLKTAISKGTLSVLDRKDIFDVLEAHHNMNLNDNRFLVENLGLDGFSTDDFRTMSEVFLRECEAYDEVTDCVKEVENAPQADDEERVPLAAIPEQDAILWPKISPFGNSMTTEIANTVLTEYPEIPLPIDGRFVTSTDNWVTLLTEFFTSPDIFPLFKIRGGRWSKDEFFAKVTNKLMMNRLKSMVPRNVLEAFLFYCHRTGQLFHIGFFSRNIYLTKEGWETCAENPISSLPRKILLEKSKQPKGITDVERLFSRHTTKFCSMGRHMTAKHLLDKISRLIRKPSLQSTFQQYLDYWSLYGRFFVYQGTDGADESTKPFSEQHLIRVNNGWNIQELSAPGHLDLGPVLPAKKLFRIKSDVLRTNLPKLLWPKDERSPYPEHLVYDAVYNRGNRSTFLNWKITRHDFHLFLRSCTENQNLLDLRFDGKVFIISNHWNEGAWDEWMRDHN